MFTGLVEGLGTVRQVVAAAPPSARSPGAQLTAVKLEIDLGSLAEGTVLGASIAINGCCLTVVAIAGTVCTFEAGPETLSRTNLGRLQPGSVVNLERSLRLGDRLGGHWVTGHIDVAGKLVEKTEAGGWVTCWFSLTHPWLKHLAAKGSITVDGVSLTVVAVEADRFSVALIPHTLAMTTLGRLAIGDPVNLETDLLAKYVERQLTAGSSGEHSASAPSTTSQPVPEPIVDEPDQAPENSPGSTTEIHSKPGSELPL